MYRDVCTRTLCVYTQTAELINKNNTNQLPKHASPRALAKQDGRLATHGVSALHFVSHVCATSLILTTLRRGELTKATHADMQAATIMHTLVHYNTH